MRLIDADKLVERLKSDINIQQNIIDAKLNQGVKDHRDSKFLAMYGFALDIICNAKTEIGECKYCREADFIYQGADFCYCLAHSTMMNADDWCSSFKEEVE